MKLYYFLFLILSIVFTGCTQSDEPDPNVDEEEDYTKVAPKSNSTLLIYSVAANNLLPTLRSDSLEMMRGAKNIPGLGKNNRVLLYFASLNGLPTLSELRLNKEGEGVFKLIKTYERTMASTHPERMKQVWQDVEYYRPAEKYNMMLESHGTGWTPYFSRTNANEEHPKTYSFGVDQSLGRKDQMDIIELSNVFRDGQLEFIWFDACYMAGIETIYQLRNKAKYFVGYVTEIWSDGVPYDRVLPYIAGSSLDLVAGAKCVFDYFNNANQPVSVSVTDLSKMEDLASATRPFATVEELPYVTMLQNYARRPNGPFYDFGQYIGTLANLSPEKGEEYSTFSDALNNALIYKAISPKDFNQQPFDTEVYSGISTHVPGQPVTSAANEAYWFQTDWGKNVYMLE